MLKKKSTVPKMQRIYSETFKMKIVDEIEQGDLTQAESSRIYNVSESTVSRWCSELWNERQNREKGDDYDRT